VLTYFSPRSVATPPPSVFGRGGSTLALPSLLLSSAAVALQGFQPFVGRLPANL